MDTPLFAPDSAQRTELATCVCGGPRARGEHLCTGAAAVHHSERVSEQADQLLNRLRAIVLMGTLDGELRPLSV